jgi:hypothetical protein
MSGLLLIRLQVSFQPVTPSKSSGCPFGKRGRVFPYATGCNRRIQNLAYLCSRSTPALKRTSDSFALEPLRTKTTLFGQALGETVGGIRFVSGLRWSRPTIARLCPSVPPHTPAETWDSYCFALLTLFCCGVDCCSYGVHFSQKPDQESRGLHDSLNAGYPLR